MVKLYVYGSMCVLQSWYLAYWWVSTCLFHELSYVKGLDPPFLSLFSMSFVLPSTICLVSWIPRIPVLWTPAPIPITHLWCWDICPRNSCLLGKILHFWGKNIKFTCIGASPFFKDPDYLENNVCCTDQRNKSLFIQPPNHPTHPSNLQE